MAKRGQNAARVPLQQRALSLRIAGKSFRTIAGQLNVSLGTAHNYVSDALGELKKQNAELADKLRDLDLARIDELLAGLWPQRKDPRAVDTITRLLERRAKLCGSDAAEKHEVSGTNPFHERAAIEADVRAELLAAGAPKGDGE